MSVIYEWDVELVSEYDSCEFECGEVVEHIHQSSYKDCIEFIKENITKKGFKYRIVLVRDDVDRRSWAYFCELEDSPIFFTDADGKDYAKIPQRFLKEIYRNN